MWWNFYRNDGRRFLLIIHRKCPPLFTDWVPEILPKGSTSPIHTNTFDIDESALKVGAGLMAWMALQELNA
ncbi:MAG: hypothetical protein R2784_13040 [Saprospiraceae bacterium]